MRFHLASATRAWWAGVQTSPVTRSEAVSGRPAFFSIGGSSSVEQVDLRSLPRSRWTPPSAKKWRWELIGVKLPVALGTALAYYS